MSYAAIKYIKNKHTAEIRMESAANKLGGNNGKEEMKAEQQVEKTRVLHMIREQIEKKAKELIDDRAALVQKIDMVIKDNLDEILKKPPPPPH